MGFDTERLAVRGRLAEKEAELRSLRLSIDGDVSQALLTAVNSLEGVKKVKALRF